MRKLCGILGLLLVFILISCSMPTQPVPSQVSVARQIAPGAATKPAASLDVAEFDSQTPQVSGAFRHDEFVITVHGIRLVPGLFVETFYDLDPQSQWPLNWAAGTDFFASADGKLWDERNLTSFTTKYVGLARVRDQGNGFVHAVPLSAMDNPKVITFAITVWSWDGYYFRAFGRGQAP